MTVGGGTAGCVGCDVMGTGCAVMDERGSAICEAGCGTAGAGSITANGAVAADPAIMGVGCWAAGSICRVTMGVDTITAGDAGGTASPGSWVSGAAS